MAEENLQRKLEGHLFLFIVLWHWSFQLHGIYYYSHPQCEANVGMHKQMQKKIFPTIIRFSCNICG